MAHPAASHFPDTQHETIGETWQTFAGAVGEARAVHLFRNRRSLDALASADQAERNGRICGLPDQVALFAISDDETVLLGQGAPIPPHSADGMDAVSYSIAMVDSRSWITDFDLAEAHGMGLRITEGSALKAALDADWVVAVGLSDADGVKEIEAFLNDVVAHGKLAFMQADQATNNAGEQTTDAAEQRFFDMENALDQSAEGAADILASSLGISPVPLRKAINSANFHVRAAAAMMRVVGPILLDDRLNGSSQFDGLSENAFIDAIAEQFLARGVHAPMQIGDGAYGVIPLTPADEFDATALDDDGDQKIAAFVQLYARLLDRSLARHADDVSLRIEPDDSDAAEKLEEILKIYPSGRRLDVVDLDSEEARPLGCP
jgi:hypothetical protein